MKQQKINSGYPSELYIGFATAFFYLVLVGILGLFMRSSHLINLPISYQNILHAHSHTALLGWAFTMAFVGTSHYFEVSTQYLKPLKTVLIISIIGMFLSFLYQGYGFISITFSSIFIGVAYVLLKKLLAVIPKTGFDNTFLRRGIIYFFFSTVGILSLGASSAILGKAHWLYDASIQFFLHFQINGFLLYIVLGLIFKQIPSKYHPKDWAPHFLDTGLVLGTALIAFWVDHNLIFYIINILGGICLWIGFVPVLIGMATYIRQEKPKYAWILILVAVGVFLRLITVVFSFNYEFLTDLKFNRPLIIAYLHLVLIGIVSIGFTWNVLTKFQWKLAIGFKIGLILFIIGFMITEIDLVLKGFGWIQLSQSANISWIFSSIMLLGIMVMFISFLSANKISSRQIK